MADLSESIKKILDENPPKKPGDFPVIFNGSEPRFIGFAHTPNYVDILLFAQQLSAEKISKASLNDDGRKFFIAHR